MQQLEVWTHQITHQITLTDSAWISCIMFMSAKYALINSFLGLSVAAEKCYIRPNKIEPMTPSALRGKILLADLVAFWSVNLAQGIRFGTPNDRQAWFIHDSERLGAMVIKSDLEYSGCNTIKQHVLLPTALYRKRALWHRANMVFEHGG